MFCPSSRRDVIKKKVQKVLEMKDFAFESFIDWTSNLEDGFRVFHYTDSLSCSMHTNPSQAKLKRS